MDLHTELARFNPDPALREWVTGTVEGLLGRVQQETAEATRLSGQIALQRTEIHLKDLKIQALALELAHYKRIRFGRQSESLAAEQKVLFEETWGPDLSAIEAEVEAQESDSTPRPKRKHAGRQPLPDHLTRIEHRHEPEACTCGQCGKDLVKIGEDITEQLDVEPARFFVHRHIRPQYACKACEAITAAPIPPGPYRRRAGRPRAAGLGGDGEVSGSFAAVSAGTDGSPSGGAARAFHPGRMGGTRGGGAATAPDRLAQMLREQEVLHADETPVQQLDPGNGKTKRAYLWAYRSNDLSGGPPMVVFDYQTSRSGVHARNFLGDWKGHLMVDDYGGYKALFRKGVMELACLAHARRKFFDLFEDHQSPIAAEALKWIAELYAIEQEGQTLDALARRQLRETLAKPWLTQYHAWLIRTRQTVAVGSATQKAIDYSLKRWNGLICYAQSGHLPIDNNPVENSIRPIAVGKKNWLYAGSERAGRRAAAIQSMMGTARLNGLELQAWLKEMLEKLLTWPNSRMDELLPIGRWRTG